MSRSETTAAQGSLWHCKYAKWFPSFISSLKLFIRIFSYSTPGDRLFLSASIVASICAGATLPLMNIIFARLVNTFNTQATSASQGGPAWFMSIINEYVLYMLYLFLGRVVLTYIAIIGFRTASLRISAAIRLHYLKSLLKLPISTLDALPPGQTAAIITITANVLQLGISERLSSLVQAIAVILVSLIIGCIYSWSLTLVTVSGVVLIVAWYAVSTPIIARRYASVQEAEREASSVVGEVLSSIRMVAACGGEERMLKKYTTIIERSAAMSRAMSPLLAVQHSPVFFTIFASFALCFWYAVKLYLNLEFASVEALVVVLMSVMTMIAHLSAISVPLTAASNAFNAAAIFFSIIDAPKPDSTGLTNSDALLDNDIEVSGVNFAYPSRHEVRVLDNFHLRIPASQTTAIVGPSGSGKSTIVALILRWYELGSNDAIVNYLRNGTITIGQEGLRQIDLHWWRSQIGLVQQEPFLFNESIFKNIEYGLVGTKHEHASEEVKRGLIEQACRDAYVDEFARRLPQGYSTCVGNSGLQLSGGQRQRIAIARAIVRNPKILIFDEATSALDVTSERIVQAALAKASSGRTTIVIAHRLSTIKEADQIIVVTSGRVLQQGSHSALMQNVDGAYRKLVNAQQLATSISQPAQNAQWSQSEVRRSSILVEKESYETLVESDPYPEDKIDEYIPKRTTVLTTQHSGASSTQDHGDVGIWGNFAMLLLEQKGNWASYIVIIIAAAGAGSTSALQAYLFARLISGFAYWGKELVVSTSFLCLMLVAVATGIGLSYFALGWIANDVSVRTISSYRREYFNNIIAKRIGFFDDPKHSPGLLTAQIATDPTQLQQLLGMNMAMVMISIFNIIGCIAIAMVFHWKFGLVVIASSLPIILAGGWYRVRHEVRFETRNNTVFAESAQFATEAIGAMRTVVSLTLERTVCEKYEAMLKNHITRSWKEARVSCVVFALSDSMVLLCMAFALWYGGTLLASGSIRSFDFLVVYLAVIQGSLAAGQWLSFGPNIAQVSSAAKRIQSMRVADKEMENRVAQRHEETHQWKIPASLLWRGADIEFRKVWFRYPTRDTPVLRDCSLRIHHGQFAAIVGSSGAGKTSIISLIERFYEPKEGNIFYNGEDTASIPLNVLRASMSLVAQEASIFRGTIKENILLGIKDEDVPEEYLRSVCRDAGIDEFISSLPDGYNTNVGTAGVSLSGGQRQRISIARALIRNPSVLLLDEATSSLDSETEKEVQAVFERTGNGRTMIVVAHRLATIQNADIIFVMHEGRVIETGDHESLLARRGRYWQMCEAQALGV